MNRVMTHVLRIDLMISRYWYCEEVLAIRRHSNTIYITLIRIARVLQGPLLHTAAHCSQSSIHFTRRRPKYEGYNGVPSHFDVLERTHNMNFPVCE